jgi:acyl transferase domain-containing protein
MSDNNGQRPVIAEYQILTALGDLNATWQGLMEGQSGLQPTMIPNVTNTCHAGKIAALGVEYGSTQRLTNLLTMGLGNLSYLSNSSGEYDIIIATTKGAADELLHNPDKATGQPWDIGQMTADITGCSGRQQIVSAACASGTVALIQAAKKIMTGKSKCVLIIGIDLLSSFVMAGFDSLKALSPNPCRPFDENRDGLSMGEGIGMVVMCSETYATEHKIKILAEIKGWGVSCDATHITAPSRSGSGLIRVIEQATQKGSIPVGAINAHGTGTVYNDAMEMTAFKQFWDKQPPFHSVKGAIGHCLGAAGVIEAAIALRSLEKGCIPPSIGYKTGNAPPGKVSGTSHLSLTTQTILACNSGFGGINAGIIFSEP